MEAQCRPKRRIFRRHAGCLSQAEWGRAPIQRESRAPPQNPLKKLRFNPKCPRFEMETGAHAAPRLKGWCDGVTWVLRRITIDSTRLVSAVTPFACANAAPVRSGRFCFAGATTHPQPRVNRALYGRARPVNVDFLTISISS